MYLYTLVVDVATKRNNLVDACLDQTCMRRNYFLSFSNIQACTVYFGTAENYNSNSTFISP